jgi:hypothetical protein
MDLPDGFNAVNKVVLVKETQPNYKKCYGKYIFVFKKR